MLELGDAELELSYASRGDEAELLEEPTAGSAPRARSAERRRRASGDDRGSIVARTSSPRSSPRPASSVASSSARSAVSATAPIPASARRSSGSSEVCRLVEPAHQRARPCGRELRRWRRRSRFACERRRAVAGAGGRDAAAAASRLGVGLVLFGVAATAASAARAPPTDRAAVPISPEPSVRRRELGLALLEERRASGAARKIDE